MVQENNLINNPDKIQAIVLQMENKRKNTNNILNIENTTTNTIKSVELLGVTIDNKLNLRSIFLHSVKKHLYS